MMGLFGAGAAAGAVGLVARSSGAAERKYAQATQDVFPGSPTFNNGYMYVNEAPGFGVDVDETLAARFPIPEYPDNWMPIRRSDGSNVRP